MRASPPPIKGQSPKFLKALDGETELRASVKTNGFHSNQRKLRFPSFPRREKEKEKEAVLWL
jgi:hypothetical protein